MNMIGNLLEKHQNQDIDKNFIDTFEALLFLTPCKAKDIYFTRSQTVNDIEKIAKSWTELDETAPMSLTEMLRSKPHNYGDSESQVTVETKFYLSDFLMEKLGSNLRRLYANANSGKSIKKQSFYFSQSSATHGEKVSKNDLLEQQDIIFKLFNIAKDYLYFDDKDKIYSKAHLGKDVRLTGYQRFCLLGLHEFLSKKHQDFHQNILNLHFPNTLCDPSFLTHIASLTYSNEKDYIINDIFSKIGNENLIQYLSSGSVGAIKSSFLLKSVNYFIEKNINLNANQQTSILSTLAKREVFHHMKLEDSEIDTIIDFFNHASYEKALANCFLFRNNESFGGKLLNKIEEIKDFQLLISATSNHKITPALSAQTLAKGNYSQLKQQDFSTLVKKVSSLPEMLQFFLNYSFDGLNKQQLAAIISEKSSNMEIVKPFYMKLRLNENLPKSSKNENSIKSKL